MNIILFCSLITCIVCFFYEFEDITFAFKTWQVLCKIEDSLKITEKMLQLAEIGIELSEKNGNDSCKEAIETEMNRHLESVFSKFNRLMSEIKSEQTPYSFLYSRKYRKCRRLGEEIKKNGFCKTYDIIEYP